MDDLNTSSAAKHNAHGPESFAGLAGEKERQFKLNSMIEMNYPSTEATSSRSQSVLLPLLDTQQAAEILRCHQKTVQDLAKRKIIPAVRYGRRWFFDGEALANWLRSSLTVSSQPLP